ncbi:PA14 domain-containing protein [Flavobacterium sp.]|uniref:PA14 domain-containing protein n=1 Tax=Flavobacterium sp. TaxID=239 RepID=UPI002616EFE5|nr:PA14 domain-containing protein [Flavobacterium sp.]
MKSIHIKTAKSRLAFFNFILLVMLFLTNRSMAQCPTPPGDQVVGGNGSWIGYVYADTDGNNPPANAFTTTYRGFITENEQFDNNLGAGLLSGTDLCGSYNNNFALRYKMQKTFTAGYYTFTVGGNDGYRLSLDGGLTFALSNWSNHSYQSSSGSYYLNGNVDLVLEYYNQNNNTRVNFSYVSCNTFSTAPSQISSVNEVCNGTPLTLTANGGYEAPGALYQWGTGNNIGSNILVGETTATLTVTPATTTTYWVRRNDPAPCSLTTSGITKTITVTNGSVAPTSVTGNTMVCYGSNTTLTANGYSGSIQWQNAADGITFTDIDGENGPNYTMENVVISSFLRVRVKNGSCPEVYSDIIPITASVASFAGVVSGGQIVCASGNTTILNLTGNIGTIQWQSAPDNINFTDINGATSASLTVIDLNTTTFYRAKVTSGGCQEVYTNPVSIIVKPTPVAGTASATSDTLCADVGAATLTLNGFQGAIQWEESNDNILFSPVPSATASSYTVTNLAASKYYRAAVSNPGCLPGYSNVLLINASPVPLAGTISGASVICSGANSTTLTATGTVGAIQWQSSTNNINFVDISGATSATFTITNLTSTTFYRMMVGGGACTPVFSPSVNMVVGPSPIGGTTSGGATICSVINSTTLTLTGYNGSIQWQSSLDNITFNDITGATATTYTAINIAATTYYRAKITNIFCPAAYSTVSTLVFSAPIAGTISGTATICLGTSATLTLSGHNGTIQWQSSLDNITFSNISGATSPTFVANNYTASTYFRARVTGGTCGSVNSASFLVSIVNNTASGGTVGITGVTGTSSGVVSGFNNLTLTLTGNSGTSRQWQSSTDNVNFTDIPNATAATYNVNNVLVSTYYRVASTMGSCTAYSTVYSVLICTPPGNPTVYGTGTNWRIYYYAQHDGANPPSDAFTTTYRGFNTSVGVETYDYTFSGNMGTNVCGTNWNNTNGAYRYRLTRNFPSGTYVFRVGSNGGYRMSVDGGTTWLINKWVSTGAYNITTSTGVPLSGNVNLVVEYFNLSTYNPRHTFNYCETNSGAPAPTSILGSSTMCLGTNTTLSVPYSYSSTCQWGTGTVVGQNIISTSNNVIFISPLVTTTYWVRRYNSICNTYSAAAFKTVTVITTSPQTPAGNTTDYGNGQWIGYVYASKTGTWPSTPAIAFNNPYLYAGYLTTPSDTFSFGAWVGSATPAQFTAATMCGYFEQYFSVRYKMTKNFTPGYYTFTISSDDGARLSIDGGVTWVINKWTATQTTYSAFLSGPTNLVLEYAQGNGDYNLNFNYTACTNLSTAPTAITGTTTICGGNSTTLTATGGTHVAGSTYEWGTGSVVGANIIANPGASMTVSPSSTTTYWVRRKNGPTCVETSGGTALPIYTTGVTVTVNVSGANAVGGFITGGGNSVCANLNSTELTLNGSSGSIQWQSSPNNASWSIIPGANATTYTATNLATTTYFRALLTSPGCAAAVTTSVNIVVVPLVAVAGTISGAGSACGTANSFSLNVSGFAGVLQWQASPDNINFNNISGATSISLNIINLPVTTYYRVVVTNGPCSSATTTSVAIVVNPISSSGTATGNTTVCSGINSSTIILTGAVGAVQWQVSSDNVTFTDVPGATSATYTAENLTTTQYYRAIVSNLCSTSTSNAVTIFVNPSPVAGTITGGTSLCFGANSAVLELSGSSGAIQWQSSVDDINFTDIPLATATTLAIYNLAETTYYRAFTSNGLCTSAYPGSVAITVNPIPVAGTISGTTTVCSGINSTDLTISGYIGDVQWQSSVDNVTFTDIPGATSAVYSAANLNATTYYKVIVSSGICNAVSTTTAIMYVRPASFSGIASGDATVCTGINTTEIQLTGFVGNIQWQSSPDNINFTNISGATSSTYSAINLTEKQYYRAVVTTNLCSSSISNSVEVIVLPYAASGNISISGTTLSAVNVCSITNSTLFTLAGSAGTPQWQSSTDNITYEDIVGANDTTYLASGLTVTTWLRAVLTSGSCGDPQTTSPVLINVPPAITYNGVWSGVPNAGTTVVVADNLNLGGNITACSCQVTGTSQLTIPNGVTMLVQKNIVVEPNASLVVENNGSIVQVDNSVVNSGNIIFKRNTSPLKQDDYTYFSSPVANQTLGALATNTYYHSYNPNVNWVPESPLTIMTPGVGYIVRAPDNLDYTLPQIYTAAFGGVPNNGIIEAPILRVAGLSCNLIGNPYPSALDIDKFILDPANTNVVNGTIYLWTHNTAISNAIPGPETNNYTTDDYAKYNLTGGVGAGSAALTGGSVPTGKVAAGQSFFIEANDALAPGTYAATFRNEMRVTGQNSQFYRSSTNASQTALGTIEKHRFWLNISDTEGSYNQTLIGYIQGATNGFDSKFDGRTLPAGNAVSLYTILGSEILAIQGRSIPFDVSDVIALGYVSLNGGNFSLNLENFDGLFQDQDIFLVDKATNTYQNLKENGYYFTTASGTFNDRFEIRFTSSLLGLDENSMEGFSVIQRDGYLIIDAGIQTISSVKIYDIPGKTIFSKNDLSESVYSTPALHAPSQLLLVRITLNDGTIRYKKILGR